MRSKTRESTVAMRRGAMKCLAVLLVFLLPAPGAAPISIALDSVTWADKCLELRDEDPYDQAVEERTFPVSGRVHVVFRILHERNRGLALGPVPVRGAAAVENW